MPLMVAKVLSAVSKMASPRWWCDGAMAWPSLPMLGNQQQAYCVFKIPYLVPAKLFSKPSGSPLNLIGSGTTQHGTSRVSPDDPSWPCRRRLQRKVSCFSLNKMINSTALCYTRKLKQKPTRGFLNSASSLPAKSLREYAIPFSPAGPAEQTLPTSTGNRELALVCLMVTMTHCWGQLSKGFGSLWHASCCKKCDKAPGTFPQWCCLWLPGWLIA